MTAGAMRTKRWETSMPNTWIPKKGHYCLCKSELSPGKHNGDVVAGLVVSVRTNGRVELLNLLNGKPSFKIIRNLLDRNYKVSKREATRVANIYKGSPTPAGKHAARMAAARGWQRRRWSRERVIAASLIRAREANELRSLRNRLSALVRPLEDWTPCEAVTEADPDPVLEEVMQKVGRISRLVEEAVEVADAVLTTNP
jgi:hypothetical protein